MATFPTGYTQQNAVTQIQFRTNHRFGTPSATEIVTLMNLGVEQVAAECEGIIANAAVPITVADTSTINLPADVGRLRNVNYTNGAPTTAGVAIYEMTELPYDEFVANTNAMPSSGLGGIATIYTVLTDASNVMQIQVYPLVSTGQINLYYYQRGALWDATNGSSVSTLDSELQEAVILWACARVCEARENLNQAAYFKDQYEEQLDRVKRLALKRQYKNQAGRVRDVSLEPTIFPPWWQF